MEIKRINADIPGSVAELQSVMNHIELKTKLYRLLLRGKGLEFDSYRDFSPDDDASNIDWKASMRTNKLLAKRYKEERNLQIVFLVDVGENMISGSSKNLKCEYAAEVAGALGHLIISSGDKVGYILFNDQVKKFVPPATGVNHFNRFIEDLTRLDNFGGGSNLLHPIDFAINYVSPSVSSVIIVSDFLSFNNASKNSLSLLAKKFETMAFVIKDPVDLILPDISGEVILEDPKSGQQILVNPHIAKQAYEEYTSTQESFLKEVCRKNNIDLLELLTNKPFIATLAEFLKGRRTRNIILS